MKVYRFRYNTDIYRPLHWGKHLTKIFGERNTGFLLAGGSEEEAYKEWYDAQAPGEQMGREYIKITLEK